jgi:hypothetical protein
MQYLQRRCARRERIAIVPQLVEQVAFYRLTRRSDIDLKNPGGVRAEARFGSNIDFGDASVVERL